jgi:hypothetical protein
MYNPGKLAPPYMLFAKKSCLDNNAVVALSEIQSENIIISSSYEN